MKNVTSVGLLSSRDGEQSQSKGLVALGLLWLLSWFSHLLAAGSAWEGSAPYTAPLSCSTAVERPGNSNIILAQLTAAVSTL